LMFTGMPIAFALGTIAVIFMFFFMPAASLDTVTQNVYEEIANITLLSIPLFILKGAAIGKSRAGADLYSAIHVWMYKVPGVLLVVLFSVYAGWRFRHEYKIALATYEGGGVKSAYLDEMNLSLAERTKMLVRILPFVTLLIGVMVALYGGYATPSETAGLGAVLAFLLIAVVYHVWKPKRIAPILAATVKESTMLMFIIGMSLFFSYVMSYLHISQSAAQGIVAMHLSKWVLLAAILLMVIVLGFFLPPVSIILMTAPIVLPPLRDA